MKKLLCFLIAIFVFSLPVIAADLDNVHEYWVAPSTYKTVEWQAIPDAAGYEIYVWRLEDSKRFLSGKIVLTNTHKILWTSKGHFVYYARPFQVVDGIKQYGEWGNSLDPNVGVVDGHPRAWVVYVY